MPDGKKNRGLNDGVALLLRAGVFVSALCVVAGGLHYLMKYGSTLPHYAMFSGEPADLRGVEGIVRDAIGNRSRGLIQFGLLVLMMTPLAWIAFLFFAFLRQRDRIYAVISGIVLAALVYSFFA